MTVSFEDHLLDLLKRVKDKTLGQSIVDLEIVQQVQVTDTKVRLILELNASQVQDGAALKETLQSFLAPHLGGRALEILVTTTTAAAKSPKQIPAKLELPHIKTIMAVSSGKGGVGKSFVAINMAYALAATGKRVGLLDLDIYGPSLPQMVGLQTPIEKKDGKMIPLVHQGVQLLSMGFLIPPEKAVIWRGPMIQTAVQQFFKDVAWGDLDCLVVDMPPGTGDTHLSLTQVIPVTGVIVVTTPQALACLDALKSIDMYKTVHIPLWGVIENMASFVCPTCATCTPVFGEGGGQKVAANNQVPFLGQIPLDPLIMQSADQGTPLVLQSPQYMSIFQGFIRKFPKTI